MPELPEVEVLVRHLEPLLHGRKVLGVNVNRRRVLGGTSAQALVQALIGKRFRSLSRRGKYLVFQLESSKGEKTTVLGHLGMTGRMYVQSKRAPLPKHAAVVVNLGTDQFVFEDTRYFGKFTLNTLPVSQLGPEPLGSGWRPEQLHDALRRTRRPIKTALLDQSLVAGVGNIYASEALFRAGIDPRKAAKRLSALAARRLWKAIRQVLREAIRRGSTIPLSFSASSDGNGFFYFGKAENPSDYSTERLLVYDREDQPCAACAKPITRIVQSNRSTFYCSHCQRAKN